MYCTVLPTVTLNTIFISNFKITFQFYCGESVLSSFIIAERSKTVVMMYRRTIFVESLDEYYSSIHHNQTSEVIENSFIQILY